MEIITYREEETIGAAQDLAVQIGCGDHIFLSGDLGAGKSVFARAMIRALSDNPILEVPSPTFTILQIYETKEFPIFHYDLYRLEDPEEIYELSWDDALAEGVVLVEWPQKLGEFLPAKRLDIVLSKFKNVENKRRIQILKVGL